MPPRIVLNAAAVPEESASENEFFSEKKIPLSPCQPFASSDPLIIPQRSASDFLSVAHHLVE